MTTKKTIDILVSNDDGIFAKGINVLVKKLAPLGHITVVAPDTARSGASSAITSTLPLRPIKVRENESETWYSVAGTPADCVKIGLNVIFAEKGKSPDLVITGINHGRNDGICVFYSGTVGAALEGCIAGLPSLAVSLNNHDPLADMTCAAEYGYKIAEKMLSMDIPKHTMLNLNIPNGEPKGLKICRQAVTKFVDEYAVSTNASGDNVYWMQGHQEKTLKAEEPDNDFDYLNDGYAVLTPLTLELTDYHYLAQLKKDIDREHL